MRRYNENFIPIWQLDDTYEVKILIAYFMWQLGRPITRDQLTEIITTGDRVNYFLYSESIEQMIESGTVLKINENGEEKLLLSETGKLGANSFKRLLPKSLRDHILSDGLKFFARLKNENTVKIDIIELQRGFSVACVCTEGDIELMNLKLFAPDREQAELLAEKIRQNPADFYASVIDFALDNEEYEPKEGEVSSL